MNNRLIGLIFCAAIAVSCATEQKTDVEEPVSEVVPVLQFGIPADDYVPEHREVQKGDYFSSMLEDYGVPVAVGNQLADVARPVFDVRDIRIGNHYEVYCSQDTSGEPVLDYLLYEKNQVDVVVFQLKDSLAVWTDSRDLESTLRLAEVTIENSLWVDVQKAGASPMLAMALSDIYAWSIDFFGLQKGDSFKALYEELTCDGKLVEIGKIQYAVFNQGGKTFESYWFDDGKEKGNRYWNEKGESLRKAFLKAPLNFSRISSGFTYSRKHPITRRVQPHTGIDYAAPKGTPVVSIGDGVVVSAKYEGAAGNTVRIKHNSVYRTAYLHLSKYGKGIKAGARVAQGQVIGYVGSTGRSTGPHLDFRIWKNDTPVNPLKMESPAAEPVSESMMEAFEETKRQAVARVDSLVYVGHFLDFVQKL